MDRGRGKCRRLHRKTRKGWASTRVVLDVGSVVNDAEARGPCWERSSALELSLRKGHTSSRRNFSSNFWEARCCLWFLLTAWEVFSKLLPWWHLQARILNSLFALSNQLETRQRSIGLQPVNHAFWSSWVTRSDHAKGIGPTRPMCSMTHFHCASQSKPACRECKGRQSVRTNRGIGRAKNLTEACPHILIVALGERFRVFWPQSAQPEIGPGGTAHEEQEVS